MSVNNTDCSPSGTCTILDGTVINGTMFVAQYDPNAPIQDPWRPKLELATICIFNSLTLIVISARLCYRWGKSGRFRADDTWMALAGIILIGYTVSQVGTNLYGSGLHFVNVSEYWRERHWQYMIGWVGYWIVLTCVKLSACCCFLQILPKFMKGLRYSTYALCAVIASLGLTMNFSWFFDCSPVASNFFWTVSSVSCINYDIFRWLWIAVSLPIDILLLYIPLRILKCANLRAHERRILKLIFCATLLGTITLTIGIYGVYVVRTIEANDEFYQEIAWLMMNDIEIFMYTLGASFPVLSNYIIQKTDSGHGAGHANFSSWARYIPNFFTSNPPDPISLNSTHQTQSADARSSIQPLNKITDPSSLHMTPSGETESDFEMSSAQKSRSETSASTMDPDLEKGMGVGCHVHVHTEAYSVERDAKEEIVNKYITSTQVIGPGW